jgi:hypothetical protein
MWSKRRLHSPICPISLHPPDICDASEKVSDPDQRTARLFPENLQFSRTANHRLNDISYSLRRVEIGSRLTGRNFSEADAIHTAVIPIVEILSGRKLPNRSHFRARRSIPIVHFLPPTKRPDKKEE